MVLAFRLYGNFHWPPLPDTNPLAQQTENGIVEIHYAEKAGVMRPFLRWTPGEIIEPPETMPAIHGSIFDMTTDKAVTFFKDNTGNDCAIWIDDGQENANIDWVSFRGAFLIDQFEAPDATTAEKLDLRWPLVRSCEYAADKTVFSSLSVGRRDGGPRFSLELHLPLPARRANLLNGGKGDPDAFPFCVVYEPGAGKFDTILNFTTLVGGWIRGDATDDKPPPSFVFADNKYPSDTRLGKFGFSAHGEPSQGDFAVYDGRQKKLENGNTNTIKAEQFWPDNVGVVIEDVLARYGFSIGPKPTEWPHLKEGTSTSDLSLRFANIEEDVRSPSVIYRMAISAGNLDTGNTDDIWKDGDGFGLKLLRETGGWISTAGPLYADCRLRWHIPDNRIWSRASEGWSPKVDLSLHWKSKIPTGENFGNSPVKKSALDVGLLRHAAHSFRQAREALMPVESGQPRSVLPNLTAEKDQTVCFTLYGPPVAANFRPRIDESVLPSGLVVWGRAAGTGTPDTPFIRPRMRLTLARMSSLIRGSGDTAGIGKNELTLIAGGQTFFNPVPGPEKRSPPISLKLSCDESWSDAGQDEVDDGEPFFASYIVDIPRTADAWSGRLSSLRFEGAAADPDRKATATPKRPDELDVTYLRAGGPGVRDGMADGAPRIDLTGGRIAAAIHLLLPISDVRPVGVDVSRMDRSGRPAPLLIPQAAESNTAKGQRYWLGVKETITPTQDRLIEADIYESAPDAGEQSYVVISQEPFSVFRYTHRPLGDRGDVGSASVAHYTGDDRIWQYRKVADHYHYVMPPQSIGEGTDKPHRLEIHDLAAGIDGDSPDAIRPFAGDGEDETGLKRRAVEFRLSPSTEFWIRPSDVERGYFMPESTSYEIFRQRGEYGLGAALAYLRGEFLYGLSVGIDVARESSVARQARVAEIEALTGRITGPARDADAEKGVNARWNALSRAVSRRPERLEVWARDPNSTIDFTPARFADGVTFSLRGTALHRPPLEKLEEAGDHQRWPKIGLVKPDPAETDERNRPDGAKPRVHPQGLSGGALWPVESVNLFNQLMKKPESSGGTIESIALSPTGGDATQKATFLGGIVTIISETRNGHVERQKVEVLGRVGALWHRAKHVVIYERTVNASAQFAPKFKEDELGTRSRRPILRKVREYVELLEHERAYPDFAGTMPRCCGFLERVCFNSRTINVDSAWSTEVGDTAWKIPLWNLIGARERPQVYPMPDIAFVCRAEGDGDNPAVSQECIDTDNLFFFSDFKATTSNTNDWKAFLDIDYANMPAAKAIAEHADTKSKKQPVEEGARRPAVTRILPGVRRFTWRLAPAAQKATINAGRAGKPVYVGLESVSFMRSSHMEKEHKALTDNLTKLLTKVSDLPQTGDAINEIKSLSYWHAGSSEVPGANAYSTAIGALVDALKSNDSAAVENSLKSLSDALAPEQLPAALKTKLGSAATQASTALKALTALDIEFDKGTKHCEKLKSDAAGMIRRKEMLICTALSDWTADIRNNFPKLETEKPAPETPITPKAAVIEALRDLILKHLEPVFADASADVGNAAEGAEKARAVVMAVEMEIEAVFTRARQRVEQFSAGYDRDKPWSAERRKSFRSGVQACLSSVATDVACAADEARQRLAVELGSAGQMLGGHVSKALAEISAIEDSARGTMAEVATDLRLLVAPVLKVINDLAPEAGNGHLANAVARIAAVQADIAAETGISAPLRTTATEALRVLSEAAAQATDLLHEVRLLLSKIAAVTEDTLGEFNTAIADLAAKAKSVVQTLEHKAASLGAIAEDISAEGFSIIAGKFDTLWEGVDGSVKELTDWLEGELLKVGKPVDSIVDFIVSSALQRLDTDETKLMETVRAVYPTIDAILADVSVALGGLQNALGPKQLLETVIRDAVIVPALETLLSPIAEDLSPIDTALATIHDALTELGATASGFIRAVKVETLGALDQVSAVCAAIFEGPKETLEYLKKVAGGFETHIADELKKYEPLMASIRAGLNDLDNRKAGFIAAVQAFDYSVRGLHNDLSRSMETAQMYGDRVLDAAGRLTDGGVMAAPSNALKLYSAVSSAPELAALKADIDRIRSGFDEISDVIDTTEASAVFNRLGDELKALGLNMPFDKISDRLQLKDLKLGNFAGLNFEHLCKGWSMPASVYEAVRVSHDFDKAQARAWVQIDIDARIPDRLTLFSLGVFQIDFVDMHLTGRVKLEASKDRDAVTQTGFSRIDTIIDLVVAGQSMVRFENFGLNFTREKGLEVEFDPKNIRLNPSFKFIQDFLSTLFPDEAGGLKIVKQDNIPVGVEHAFVIPPMTLNFGTSGVSNISIENHFRLVAFPDFMIANRFNLSTIERPFIFSIFVIGGTGYVQIDAEYRPFDSQLMVSVEAGAGGSAALAFAVGPFVGQVFITLSGTMTYRKMIGKPGGGLSLAVVLVIAGQVEVCGMVSVGITLMLRMSYRDDGAVDGQGTLSVSIRISRFFTISAHATVNYKLRGGKSETSVSSGVAGNVDDDKLAKKVEQARTAVDQLQKASN